MAESNKSFSESRFYPIIFMIIVAAFFGLILSVFYHSTKDRVERYAELRFKEAILTLFEVSFNENDIETVYENYVEEIESEGLSYWSIRDDRQKLGYCFYIEGSGLWGTITALIGVDTSLQEMKGLFILDQNETPGLGGRITEERFQNQFSGKKIMVNGEIVNYQLIAENDPASESEINQVTGATSSSKAVVDMVHKNLLKIVEVLQPEDTENEEIRDIQ